MKKGECLFKFPAMTDEKNKKKGSKERPPFFLLFLSPCNVVSGKQERQRQYPVQYVIFVHCTFSLYFTRVVAVKMKKRNVVWPRLQCLVIALLEMGVKQVRFDVQNSNLVRNVYLLIERSTKPSFSGNGRLNSQSLFSSFHSFPR